MRKSNVFEAVKESVTTRQAAEYYGVQVGRNGMACCPFPNWLKYLAGSDQRMYFLFALSRFVSDDHRKMALSWACQK